MTYTPITPEHIQHLVTLVGESNVSIAQADIDQHASDESFHKASPPEVVVWCTDAEQVAAILRYANKQHFPVTAWGVGTSLEGNPIPVYGGILLSLERMNKIITVHDADFQVTVQPGLGHKDLNQYLARYGLFFPPDPGANASIGGMLANNAAGIRTVKYGASKDNVLRMQVALADGRLIEVGSRSVKQSSGYDLLHLLVGSEGTLGIITEATLRLCPIPMHMSAVVAAFNTVEDAVETVVAVRGSGIEVAALEFIDASFAGMLAQAEGIDMLPKPTVFMEFHAAHENTLNEELAIIQAVCEEAGAIHIQTTTDNRERLKLWSARHQAYEILVRWAGGKKIFIMDVAVPISAYPELIAYVENLRYERGIQSYLIGHAGDGNIHVNFPYDTQAEFETVLECDRLIVKKAIALGGTCTGEHGVGIGKREFMQEEHGESLNIMREIKRLFDPNTILNPGKIFPE